MSKRILATIRHEIVIDADWEDQAETDGFDPDSPYEMLEWIEQFKDLGDFETDREVYYS